MSLPFIVNIVIGLIFIYLILGLLASEIQELITTFLHWRAKHLKESIEKIFASGESTTKEINKAKKLASRICNEIQNQQNIELIYISPTTFSKILIQILNLYILSENFIELRLDNFVRRIIAEIKGIAEQLQEDVITDESFEVLKQTFFRINSGFKNNQFTLQTMLQSLSENLDIYINSYPSDNKLSTKNFRFQVECLKQNFFGDKNEIAIISAKLKPSLTEIIDIISIETSIHGQIKERMLIKDVENYNKIAEVLDELPTSLKDSLGILARQAQTKVKLTENEILLLEEEISTWFERSMERASGVYKRNAKGVAILIGFLVAFITNADTLHIVNRLSRDDTLRQVMTESASQVKLSPANSRAVGLELENLKDQTHQALEDISLPLGWTRSNLAQQFNCSPSSTSTIQNNEPRQGWATLSARCIPENKASTTFFVPQKIAELMIKRPWLALKMILGWFVSGIAIAMGSSFWFALLSKVVNVRNFGLQRLRPRRDQSIPIQTPSSGKIIHSNKTQISELLKLLRPNRDEYVRWLAASRLRQIAANNRIAIATLLHLMTIK